MKKALSFLLVMAACLLAATTSVHAAGILKIHMLSALDGRADCFIIELPDDTKMVVDCPEGWDTALISKLNALGFGGGIKYLCGTHEHVDHIGGMNNFINSGFNINNTQIYYPKGAINADGVHYNNLVSACNSHGLTIKKLIAGDYIINTTYNGLAFKVRCISPENSTVDGGSDDWGSENEASLVLKITYGSKSILMQGDAYGSTELSILSGPYASEVNNCQVLKVGHHGVNANGALSCREAYIDAAGVNRAFITDGDLAIDATIKQRLQDRNIRYWSSGDGDGYAWLSTDGVSNWVESEPPLWPATTPPSITTQPSSQTVNPGANVTFTVTASGTAPLTYQWRFNAANISGATATSYTKSNAQSGDAGNYSVVVNNAAGSATSANAVLTVRVPPSITTQPSSQTVNPGANVTFTVSASGTAPLTYQWTFNGANISGATASSLVKSNVQSGDAGNYAVVVTNVAGSATSANAALSVNVPPSIMTQPSSQTVNSGANVTFTVSASGTAPLTYQWTFNGVNISGATATSFTKSNVQSGDAGNYAAVVSNIAGSATSANAALSVNVPPSITTQPVSQTVNSGANVTFTVVAAGTAPLSYQWRFNGVNISGATSSSYTKSNAQSSDAGNYAVVITNVAGSVTSANALLTVTTTMISDTYNVTTSGTGFGLNAGVNTGINPPTTRLTGSTISSLRYIQTVTTRSASAYDINGSRLRVTTGNTIGRFTLSANGTAPFDFGPALGTSSATPANPVVYDVKIGMRNDATGNPRFSLGLATVEGDINNMDFAVQMYRANTADTFYTIQKRIDRGSFNGTTTTDGTGDINAVMITTAAGTAATMMDFLIRVTDAGAESGTSYNSRVQVSTNNGSSWIYDTASDSAVLNRFRFDGTGRYFAFDQAPNTTGNIFYNAFSVTTWNTAPPQSPDAPLVNNFETWKASYGITDPNADNDGDGQSNYAEYIANTDPNSATSYLKILNATSQNGHVTVSWASVGGTRYRLQQANGFGAAFTDIVRNAADETDPAPRGKASTQSFTDTSKSSNEVRFYRIKVVE